MDKNGIINQIGEWYDKNPTNRCAFVLLVEREESDDTLENNGCLIGSSKLLTKSLAYQICKEQDTKEVIVNGLLISEFLKLNSIKEIEE